MKCGKRTERVFSRTNEGMVCMNESVYIFSNNLQEQFMKVLFKMFKLVPCCISSNCRAIIIR